MFGINNVFAVVPFKSHHGFSHRIDEAKEYSKNMVDLQENIVRDG